MQQALSKVLLLSLRMTIPLFPWSLTLINRALGHLSPCRFEDFMRLL